MLEALLAMLLAALAAVGTQRAMLRSNAVAFATIQADVLDTARRGINFYIFENYIALQNGQPVSKNAVTLAPGTAEGQSMRPTAADLRAMEYLPAGFPDVAVMNQGRYQFQLVRNPLGCAGPFCEINGHLWIDRPLLAQGSATEPDGVSVSTIMLRVGGTSMASLLTAPGVLTGAGNSFTLPNPVPGAPAGVVGVRVGFAAAVEGAYVRVNDTRDPNLRGPLTVQGPVVLSSTLATGTTTISGDLTVNGRTTSRDGVDAGTATGGGGCFRSSLGSDGRLVMRRADCTTAIELNADASRIAANDAAARPRVVLDGVAGSVTLSDPTDPANSLRARIDGTSGRATVRRTQMSDTATAGADCSSALEGDIVLDAEATGGTVVCRSGFWRRSGLPPAADGQPCTGHRLGQDTAGTAFLCRDGQWASLTQRITRSVVMARYLVGDDQFVPHPTCPAGAVPAIVLTPVETAVDNTGDPARNRYAAFAVDDSGGWAMRIRLYDAAGGTGYTRSFSGQAYGLRAIAQTFCDFAR